MADYLDKGLRKFGITISKPMLAALCIIFGTLVIMFPNLLVWIVGLFLLVQGILLFTDLLEGEMSGITTVSKGVYCSHCGTRNIEESVYCKKCGKSLIKLKKRKSRIRTK